MSQKEAYISFIELLKYKKILMLLVLEFLYHKCPLEMNDEIALEVF